MILINDTFSIHAYKKKIDLGFSNRKYGGTRSISLIGILQTGETVSLEIPKVINPDEAIDSDWMPLIQFNPIAGLDEPLIFIENGENVKIVSADLTVRIVKSVTSNNIGVAIL